MQLLAMPVWIAAVDITVLKALPGTDAVATPGTTELGMLPRWQFSHLVELGICEPQPGPLDCGITTMLVTPAKVPPDTFGPWHTSQPELIPLWLKPAPLNLALSCTGTGVLGT